MKAAASIGGNEVPLRDLHLAMACDNGDAATVSFVPMRPMYQQKRFFA